MLKIDKNVHVKADLEDKIFDKSLNINNELNYWIANQSFDFDAVLSMGLESLITPVENDEVESSNTFVSEQPKKRNHLKIILNLKRND